jgi:hypothetical protein
MTDFRSEKVVRMIGNEVDQIEMGNRDAKGRPEFRKLRS